MGRPSTQVKPKKLKINKQTKELRGNCNLFARCALIRGQREIEMKVVVGDYELMVYPKSLLSKMAHFLMAANQSLKLSPNYSNTLDMSQVINHQQTQILL